MIQLTLTSENDAKELTLPITLEELAGWSAPLILPNGFAKIEFQTPDPAFNDTLNRCIPNQIDSSAKELHLLAYLLKRMEPYHIDWLGERLPNESCTVSELLRRADYCCNVCFFRDGTPSPHATPPKDFHPSYNKPALDEMLQREFEGHVERQRLTSGQLFEKTIKCAKANGDMERFEEIIEYILPENYENGKLTEYSFDFVPVVNFGGSEGIYIDCVLKGKFDEYDHISRDAGTLKTLKTDLDACKIMGELCGALMYHNGRYVNENLYLFSPTAEIERSISRKIERIQAEIEQPWELAGSEASTIYRMDMNVVSM